MTRSPPDQSGGRYGGGLTIPEFFAEPCGAHMRLMRQWLDCQATPGRSVPAVVSGCGLSVAIAVLLAFVGNVAAQDRFP
jgi:hypothetical protein